MAWPSHVVELHPGHQLALWAALRWLEAEAAPCLARWSIDHDARKWLALLSGSYAFGYARPPSDFDLLLIAGGSIDDEDPAALRGCRAELETRAADLFSAECRNRGLEPLWNRKGLGLRDLNPQRGPLRLRDFVELPQRIRAATEAAGGQGCIGHRNGQTFATVAEIREALL